MGPFAIPSTNNNVLFRFGQFHLRLPLSGWANGYIYMYGPRDHRLQQLNNSMRPTPETTITTTLLVVPNTTTTTFGSRHYQISTWEKGLSSRFCCQENCSGIWNLGVQTVEPYLSSVCTHLYTSIFFFTPPMLHSIASKLITLQSAWTGHWGCKFHLSWIVGRPKKLSKNKLK